MIDQQKQIETIKQLKARYFRLLDAKDWTALGDCVTEDVEFKYPPQKIHVSGKTALIGNFSTRHAVTKTAHTGSMPEIKIIDETNAEGIWFMTDYIIGTDENKIQTITQGFGHYFETYRFEDKQWKISNILLERLFIIHPTLESISKK